MLLGIETEYGFSVEGRGAETQVEDCIQLVRGAPGELFAGWDSRFEFPRADLRGFKVQSLAVDPSDLQFDRPLDEPYERVRSDRVLSNGARFYNDHGHPEYATPECRSLSELALHDQAGERFVLRAAKAFERAIGQKTHVYKNNSDGYGASYGTHESYLAPRALGFQGLFESLIPMLAVRQILCGAGKVGSESGGKCDFQISQRADFFSEAASVDTLYRRPLFNTRDEPHADPRKWIRVHVIAGDANLIPSATRRKVGLIVIALKLAEIGEAPLWKFKDPVKVARELSRTWPENDRIELEGRSWTTARHVFESYFAAAERFLDLQGEEGELGEVIGECRALHELLQTDYSLTRGSIDWAAKRWLLDQIREDEGLAWSSPTLHSIDLAYHDLDPETGLHWAMRELGEIGGTDSEHEIAVRMERVLEPTRARARSVAVRNLSEHLESVGWRAVRFRTESGILDLDLDPAADYSEDLEAVRDVQSFIGLLPRAPEANNGSIDATTND